MAAALANRRHSPTERQPEDFLSLSLSGAQLLRTWPSVSRCHLCLVIREWPGRRVLAVHRNLFWTDAIRYQNDQGEGIRI